MLRGHPGKSRQSPRPPTRQTRKPQNQRQNATPRNPRVDRDDRGRQGLNAGRDPPPKPLRPRLRPNPKSSPHHRRPGRRRRGRKGALGRGSTVSGKSDLSRGTGVPPVGPTTVPVVPKSNA